MSFTVGRDSHARIELARIWATAPNPATVRAAFEAAERMLAADPVANGRHLSEGLWQVHVAPLLVCYTIDAARRHVEITDVIYTGRDPTRSRR